MAGILSAFLPEDDPSRRNRLWIRIEMPASNVVYGTANGELPQWTRPYLKPFGDAIRLYIPMTGSLPVLTFKNTYEPLVGEMSVETRAMADLVAGIGNRLATAVGNGQGGPRDTISGVLRSGAGLASMFAGNVNSPKVWMNSNIEDLRFSGTLGFENIYEFKYYKAMELLLQYITRPVDTGDVVLGDLLAKFTENTKFIDKIRITTMSAPKKNFVDLSVVTGKAKELKKPGPIELEFSNPSGAPLLLMLPTCNMPEFEWKYGTEEGRGIDDNGVAHLMSYELAFAPVSIKSLFQGLDIMSDVNSSDIAGMDLKYNAPLIPTAVDKANMTMYSLYNLLLIGAVPGYLLGQAQGLARLPEIVTRGGITSLAGRVTSA